MQGGSNHNVRAKIDQEIIVDQGSRALAETWTTQRSCSFTVGTLAKGFGIGIRSRSPQKRDDHLSQPDSGLLRAASDLKLEPGLIPDHLLLIVTRKRTEFVLDDLPFIRF